MSSLLIRHHVADYDAWKAVFNEQELTRRANGTHGGKLFHSSGDPNEILLLLEWDDLDRARLFADSDDLREAMARSGVTDQSDIWFLVDVVHLNV